MKKKLTYLLLGSILALALSVPAVAVDEGVYDPEPLTHQVRRGFLINNSHFNYLLVKITDSYGVVRYEDQIPPRRPVTMPHQKWGNDYLPDLKSYEDLVQAYIKKHGTSAVWRAEIFLPVGTFTIQYKWSHLPDWKTATFSITEEDLLRKESIPFYFEFDDEETP